MSIGEVEVHYFRLSVATFLLAGGSLAAAGSQSASFASAAPVCAVDEADLERFVATRTNYGLESRIDHVRDVSCPGDAPDGRLGIPLDEAESMEMLRREAAGLTFSTISAHELATVPDRFAGVWIDQAAGGIVVVAYTEGGADRLEVIRRLLPAGTEVAMKQATVTQARLNEIYENLRKVDRDLEQEGIRTLGGEDNIVEGTYTILVADEAPADAEERIAAAVGGWEGLVIERADDAAVDFQDARDTPTGRAYGGTSIGRVEGQYYWHCTASPSARSAAGHYYTVTAGHCGRIGWTWRQGYPPVYQGATLGPGQGNTIYSPSDPANAETDCDCQGIGPIPSAKRTAGVLLSNNAVYLYTDTAISESSYYVNRPVCVSGASSWQIYGYNICGEITGLAGTAPIYPNGVRIDIVDQIATNIWKTVDGDSGGPYGDGTYWLGIHSFEKGGYANFSRTTRMVNDLRIDLVNLGY